MYHPDTMARLAHEHQQAMRLMALEARRARQAQPARHADRRSLAERLAGAYSFLLTLVA
jgi:hypothetical protein